MTAQRDETLPLTSSCTLPLNPPHWLVPSHRLVVGTHWKEQQHHIKNVPRCSLSEVIKIPREKPNYTQTPEPVIREKRQSWLGQKKQQMMQWQNKQWYHLVCLLLLIFITPISASSFLLAVFTTVKWGNEGSQPASICPPCFMDKSIPLFVFSIVRWHFTLRRLCGDGTICIWIEST